MNTVVEHLVLFKVKSDTTEEERELMVTTLKRLQSMFDGIVEMSVGINNSKEGKSKGFELGLRMLFRDQAALNTYVPSPQHIALVNEIRTFFEDVIVVDYVV